MLFLLPPSETKRSGGTPGTALDFDALSFPSLTRARRSAIAAVVRLSRDTEASMTALKIGERLRPEAERNRLLRRSETLPALERYTGVVYDPVDASSLSQDAAAWAGAHIAIHSALFGLVGAFDPIPAYRLSHDSRVPGLALRSHWSGPVSRALTGATAGGGIVDLRSEGYVDLGPAPHGSAYLRVVSDDGGRRRALNHFNKKTKGTLIAKLLGDRPDLVGVGDFIDWARSRGIVVEESGGELVVVSESVLSAHQAT